MHDLIDYRMFISEVDRHCDQIVQRHADQIACAKGCAGNCCRIHLSVYPVEAVSISLALQVLPSKQRQYIRNRARQTGSFGPCPLLEDHACLMYDSRAVICRTHGLPMSTEYRGHRAIGYCIRNFTQTDAIPEENVIDLGRLNGVLADLNERFVREHPHLNLRQKRYTFAEAILMPAFDS